MAKKFVRGITDVKTINNQDFDTNNVNDLLSDGQYNYIHRKKGKSEEYHNLTDNIKTISSDNTELLAVTNNNKTTNTATLHPKHDAQKEQVLESTRDTIAINHGTNGTAEKTTVDVNFEKVQEKLTAGDGLAIESNEIKIKPKNVETLPANSGFYSGAFMDGEWGNPYTSISLNIDTNKFIQLAFRESVNTSGVIIGKYRFIVNNVATSWKEMQLDSGQITSLLAQKQDKLTAGDGITIEGQTISASGGGAPDAQKEQFIESTRNTVNIQHGTNGTAEKTTVDTNPQKVLEHENLIAGSYLTKTSSGNTSTLKISDDFVGIVNGKQNALTSNASIGVLSDNGLRQLYLSKKEYHADGSYLKTHIKLVSANTDKDVVEEEYSFILKIKQGSQDATFTLHGGDKTKFNNIISAYGTGNTVRINGCLFTLSVTTSDTILTVTTDGNTASDNVITFSDII